MEHHPVADLFPMLPEDELKELAGGGTNHVKNLRLAHRWCNRDKADA
ncbi:MAG: hypothetical protein ACRDQA_07550 [Nocardioidaceae bacterium]